MEESLITGMQALQKFSLRLSLRLLIDLLSLFMLLQLVYRPRYKKHELFFTFTIFNLVIFLVSFLLGKVELSMGAAFGLFAVFSMLRYRTEEISIKDMTWLFLVIALGLMNAITKIKGASDGYEYLLLVFINGGVLLLALLLESRLLFNKESSKTVTYEKIGLIHESQRQLLIDDLRARTGLDVKHVSVLRIDFVNDSALLKVYYSEKTSNL